MQHTELRFRGCDWSTTGSWGDSSWPMAMIASMHGAIMQQCKGKISSPSLHAQDAQDAQDAQASPLAWQTPAHRSAKFSIYLIKGHKNPNDPSGPVRPHGKLQVWLPTHRTATVSGASNRSRSSKPCIFSRGYTAIPGYTPLWFSLFKLPYIWGILYTKFSDTSNISSHVSNTSTVCSLVA